MQLMAAWSVSTAVNLRNLIVFSDGSIKPPNSTSLHLPHFLLAFHLFIISIFKRPPKNTNLTRNFFLVALSVVEVEEGCLNG